MFLALPRQTRRWNPHFSKFTLHSERSPVAGLLVAQGNIGSPFIVTLLNIMFGEILCNNGSKTKCWFVLSGPYETVFFLILK